MLFRSVGVGLGLASGQSVSNWASAYNSSSSTADEGITADKIEAELLRLVVDGRENKVTFDEFPYYIR